MKKKILLIRLDKIGDLICTLCVDQIAELKSYETSWVISKGLNFIPENALPSRPFLALDKNQIRESLRQLRTYLRTYKPDIAVSFQAPWWVHYALWREGVPVRAGVQSQWHSFLFLNRGLRQKRSRAIQHESQYNLELLHAALDLPPPKEEAPVLELQAPLATEPLRSHGLREKSYIVVHPGMAGSALNWPVVNYISLIGSLAPQQVVITGTPADELWLTEIKRHFQSSSHVLILQNRLSTLELLSILKFAQAVVVPSTGVAHLAASLGTKVVGLYSPIRVQHPRRWAARGPQVHIFVPEVADADQTDQIEAKVMEQISPREVLEVIKRDEL